MILGIDPGTHKLGYGIIEDVKGRLKYIDSGVVKATGATVAIRLEKIRQHLLQIIRHNTWDTLHAIAIERCFVGLHKNAVLGLGRAIGVVYTIAWDFGIVDIAEYDPKKIKRSVAGGNSKKDVVALMVRNILRLDFTPEYDAADALAVAIHHANCIAVKV